MNFFRVVNNLFRFNRTNWKAVSLCFIGATVFWFFNALNKNYSTNVRLPLQFEFDETKYVPSRPLPPDVYVNLGGNGWDLLRKYLGLKLPAIIIPLERPSEIRKIVGSTLPPILASQLGNLKVNHIVTDTLYISIEVKDSVKLKVVIDPGMITYKEGFGRTSPIVALPDSIQVEGPKSIIGPLHHSSLVITLPARKVNSNYREQIGVAAPEGESVRRKPNTVEIMFEVGEVEQVEKTIKLDLVQVPDATHVLKDKDSVRVVLEIPRNRVDDFNQVFPGMKAFVDLTEERHGNKKLIPSLTGIPAYANVLHTDSVRLKLY